MLQQIALSIGYGVLTISLLALSWNEARQSLAAFLTAYASSANQIEPVTSAVRLNGKDPEAYYLRASLLAQRNDTRLAQADYLRAVSLRPEDYVVWLGLTRVLEITNDRSGALVAAKQAVDLAPYYSEPHWVLGQLLVRSNEFDQGFQELRAVITRKPELVASVIDLAWRLSGGDTAFVQGAVGSDSFEANRTLAEFLIKHSESKAAVALLRAAGNIPEDARRVFVAELIEQKNFDDAYELWEGSDPQGNREQLGFKNEIDPAGNPFSWTRTETLKGYSVQFDKQYSVAGQSSLKLEFSGETDASKPLIKQLLLVQPNARYIVRFSVRSQSIVSGCLPQIIVLDANQGQVLASAGPVPIETNQHWQEITTSFHAANTTTAVWVQLQREQRQQSLCPIFGVLWLDNFSLTRV